MEREANDLAARIACLFAELPGVEAVALSGSRAGAAADLASDIDLYVYTRAGIPLAERLRIVEQSGGASQSSLDLNYWGSGDEWYHQPSGIEVDIVYFDADWMAEQIERVVLGCQASTGYTTCFWHTVAQSRVFFDRQGWFAGLQELCSRAYPEALRENIIALNHPLLRGVIPAYAHQLEKASRRGDLVSVNHRLAALLASYFDILFALNRQLHPGEKRLIEKAVQLCAKLPAHMPQELKGVIESASSDLAVLPQRVTTLLDHLDELLESEGLTIA